jgi:DNA-binding transcriptional regulator YhcF (GntR family)
VKGKDVRPTLDNDRPIFLQVKEAIENDILTGQLKPDEQIPSNSQLVSFFGINPVTVHKGVTLLLDGGVVYKKRGLGMFVSPDAPAMLRKRHGSTFAKEFVEPAIKQAHLLGIGKQELKAMLDKNWNQKELL